MLGIFVFLWKSLIFVLECCLVIWKKAEPSESCFYYFLDETRVGFILCLTSQHCWNETLIDMMVLFHTTSVHVQLLSHVWLFATPWTAASQASLFFIIFQSLLKSVSIESVILSNHLGERNGSPLQYSCLGNPMDGGAWYAAVHGVLRVRLDWETSLSHFTFMHWRRKWQPTPVFLHGESQGRGSLLGCCLWVTESWTQLKRLSSSSS